MQQRLHVRQVLRRRGHQARRQRAEPLPDELFFHVRERGFIQPLGEQQQPFTIPRRQFRTVDFIFRAAGQTQPLVAETVKAAAANAGHVQPALFVEAKQRGAHKALAKSHPFQQGRQAAEPDLSAAVRKRVAIQ